MDRTDCELLRQYRGIGLSPWEAYKAAATLAGLTLDEVYCEKSRLGTCPGKTKCHIAIALLTAYSIKPDRATANGQNADSPCEDLALSYPDIVLHYFWNDRASAKAHKMANDGAESEA